GFSTGFSTPPGEAGTGRIFRIAPQAAPPSWRFRSRRTAMIPIIDVTPLFGPASLARNTVDQAVLQAASGIGFMTITGFAGTELLDAEKRHELLAIFKLPEAEKAKLLRWNFDPTSKNLYRGWFPLQHGVASHK